MCMRIKARNGHQRALNQLNWRFFAYFICGAALTCPLDDSHKGNIWFARITQLSKDFCTILYFLLRIRFPGRPIFMQFIPGNVLGFGKGTHVMPDSGYLFGYLESDLHKPQQQCFGIVVSVLSSSAQNWKYHPNFEWVWLFSLCLHFVLHQVDCFCLSGDVCFTTGRTVRENLALAGLSFNNSRPWIAKSWTELCLLTTSSADDILFCIE